MSRRLLGILLLVVSVTAGGVAVWRWSQPTDPVAAAMKGDEKAAAEVRAPTGVRIRVQVINTTSRRGLARRATRVLRERGFDVVESGSARPERATTLVLDRSGHPDWARLVAGALGGAQVETRRDSSRYLDVTVLLGRSWRPPSQPFHP